MNFLYFIFVSLIWVSTQGGFSVLTETTETEPTDPPEPSYPEICTKMLSCRGDSNPDAASGKYLCNAPVEYHFCLDKCWTFVVGHECGRNTTCVTQELPEYCICDKDRYVFGFRCQVTDKAPTNKETEAALKNVCERMDSCNPDAICDDNDNCVCPGTVCKDKCRKGLNTSIWFFERFSIGTIFSEDCLCKKNYSSPLCKVTESPTVVTTTTTEDDGIQEGWKTETNIEWLLSSLKNMQYAAWHIFKDEGFGRYGGRGGYDGYDGYGRHGVKSQDPPEETGDSSSTATENNSGNQGNDGN